MPYSMDSEENKRNARSPSEHMTVNEQLMYKLAALDAAVTQGFRRLDEKMDRFQSDLHDSQISTNDRINTLDKEFHEAMAFKRARIDTLVKEGNLAKAGIETRLISIETWQKVSMARVGIIMGVMLALWTFLAPTLRTILGISNG